MKAEKLLMSISLLAILLLFSGCGKELEDLSSPETGSGVESPDGSDQAEGEILRLQVSDAGFSDANTGSRAIDEGLTTTFEDGDLIGLFVVNSQDKILYANVPYTKDGDVWTAKENIRTKGYPVRVFAYYPYVPDDEIIAKVDSTADNYSAFFKQYIEGLDISNQSSQEGYRKTDVMACMVKVGSKEEACDALTLTMNHLMGLVVVNLPETVILSSVDYCLKDDESYMWTVKDVTLPANLSDELFEVTGGIQPLKEETGYRYLCRPEDDGISNISFSGSFITYGETKNYEVNNGIVSAGSNQIYNLSVKPFALTGTVEYTPHVGDFYMNDGAILPSISEDNIRNCIGIVFWLGVPTATDPVLANDHSNCTHGLVVSLKSTSCKWQANYESATIQSWADSNGYGIGEGFKTLNNNVNAGTDNPGDIQGYNNTKILEAYDSKNSSAYSVTVLDCFDNITSNVSLPIDKTSGWYLPSPKELVLLYNVMSKVNTSLSVFKTEVSSTGHWSSGEYNYNYGTWVVYMNKGYVDYAIKNNVISVRLVFAF